MLQPPAGLNSVQIPVNVNLEHYRRVIGRTTGRFRIDTAKAYLAQVQLVDKSLDDTHRIIRSDVIIDTIGQQSNLSPVRAFDESLHGVGPAW